MTSISLKKFIEENTPAGMVYDAENSTPDNIVFKEKPKSTRWEDLEDISGYYADDDSIVSYIFSSHPTFENQNIYATEGQCEAHLAQAKLSQIMKAVNGYWVPDWDDSEQTKYYIVLYRDDFLVGKGFAYPRFLTFKSEKIAEQVLRENKDLLEQYKPLAG